MKDFVKSPLNYSGNKFKLLPQLLPLFPEKISTFVDLFGGSFTVGMNMDSNVVYNELDVRIFELVKFVSTCDYIATKKKIEELISEYNLGKNTKEEYSKLREYYNKSKDVILLFLLSCFSFNYQIRFNSKGDFNMPCGNRGFSKNMDEWFKKSNELCKKKKIMFCNKEFDSLNLEKLNKESFLYLDPPYLQTIATYTENGGWNEEKENRLYNFLDKANFLGLKFGLSNTMWYHNEENLILKKWSKKYNVHELDFNYMNNRKDRDKNGKTVEVFICNY